MVQKYLIRERETREMHRRVGFIYLIREKEREIREMHRRVGEDLETCYENKGLYKCF